MERVKRGEGCDKGGRNPFGVATNLTQRDIVRQILFVHAFERTYDVPYIGPHACDRVAMHLSNPIAIVITRSFMPALCYRCMTPDHIGVALIFISV